MIVDDLKIYVSNLSDTDLDSLYARSSGRIKMLANSEIVSRLATPWGFVTGAFGHVRFPLYNADPRAFHQSDEARASISVSSKNLADNVGSKLAFGGGIIIIALFLIVSLIVFLKFKK